MYKCRKCGEEISEDQYYDFNMMCPQCNRIHHISKNSAFSNVGTLGCILILAGVFSFFAGFLAIDPRNPNSSGPVVVFTMAIILLIVGIIITLSARNSS